MVEESQKLYEELLGSSRERLSQSLQNYPTFSTQLKFDSVFNSACISIMYNAQRHQKPLLPKTLFWSKICGLRETCYSCANFYVSQRTNSDKSCDIELGKQFENELMEFLKSLGIATDRADNEKKNAPDIKVLSKDMSPSCYLEIKYLSAPFVLRNKFAKDRECYEGSTTLDSDKKILDQRRIVENEIRRPVYYVYWLDYPCIKGIFFMDSKEVYQYLDSVNNLEWTRKTRSGDFSGNTRVGHNKKVYLPLLKMGNFEEFLKNLSTNSI
jgi:hypothetical protein